MTGLKRRVIAGFLSIVAVLILSGVVSFVELSILSRDTDDVLGANDRSKSIASSMIKELRSHSKSFVELTAFNQEQQRSKSMSTLLRLDSLLIVAMDATLVPESVDSITSVVGALRELTEEYITEMNISIAKRQQLDVRLKNINKNIASINSSYQKLMQMDSLKRDSIESAYRERKIQLIANRDSLHTVQIRLDSLDTSLSIDSYYQHRPIIDRALMSVDNFVVQSLQSLLPGAEQLHNKAYRSVTPVLISLVVMIAIVLMLFYFMMIYCVNPIVEINNSLKSYLGFKVPFAPKCVKRDEVQDLSDNIEQLIVQSKRLHKIDKR